MTLTLIQLVDKWVLEHGSASLSKEVIADLRQKIVDSDSAHAKEIQELKAACAKDTAHLNELYTKEIARLNESHAVEMADLERTMAELQKPQTEAKPQVGERETNMLKLLAASGGAVLLDDMPTCLSIPPVVNNYTFDNLRKLGFVGTRGIMENGTRKTLIVVTLTTAGNAYIVENGLTENLPPAAPPIERPFW